MEYDSCKIGYIYTLNDPDNKKIRYVGQSIQPQRRFLEHIKNKVIVTSHKEAWIEKLRKNSKVPYFVVHECVDYSKINGIELKWIRLYESQITNHLKVIYEPTLKNKKKGSFIILKNSRGLFEVTYEGSYCGNFSTRKAAEKIVENLKAFYENGSSVTKWDISTCRKVSTRLHRLRNYKSPYKGITWESKSETYKIFDPNQNLPIYITSEKDLEKARQIQLDYLNGKSVEQIQSEKVTAHRNKYRGVSFSEKDQAYLVTLKLPGENKHRLLAQFSDEEKAKEWHDVVANYYDLPINEEPIKSLSFEEAKKQIRLDRGQETEYVGVSKYRDRFVAKISLKGKTRHLGIYNTKEEAVYIADSVRNYYGLRSNNTTPNKLFIEEIIPKKEKCQYKNIRLNNKTGKYVVHFQQVKPKVYVGEYVIEEKALLHRDQVAKHLGLPTEVHHNCSPITVEEAKIQNGTRLSETKETLYTGSQADYIKQSTGNVGISFDKKIKKYRVTIYKDGNRHSIGSYTSIETAQKFYDKVDSGKLTVNEAKYFSRVLDNKKLPGIVYRSTSCYFTINYVDNEGKKQKYRSPTMKDKKLCVYYSIAARNYYNLPTNLKVTTDKLSIEQVKEILS